MKFERDKLYKTRGGEIRRVICVDANTSCPIVSLGIHDDTLWWHYSDGTVWAYNISGDLIAEYREPREWFICLNTWQVYGAASHEEVRSGRVIRVREVLE